MNKVSDIILHLAKIIEEYGDLKLYDKDLNPINVNDMKVRLHETKKVVIDHG